MDLRTLTIAALMASIALAGCINGDDGPGDGTTPIEDDGTFGPAFTPRYLDAAGLPVPEWLCHDRIENTAWDDDGQLRDFVVHEGDPMCNFEMTPDDGREGNEVTIAVNPTDPRNIVGGAKDYYPLDAGECVWDGVYVTHDGGRTPYHDRSFDGSPWRAEDLDPSDFEPNYASQFWCTTDPVAYFDVNGNLYYLLMAYQADRVTGSDIGEGVVDTPVGEGALNDWAFNRAVQIVAISDDGGDTFHTFTPTLEGTYPVNFHDRGWLAASADGTIHVVWLDFLVGGNQYCRSTDGGQTYLCGAPLTLTLVDGGQGSVVDVGTGPQVYFTWAAGGGFTIARSFDTGATWDEPRMVQGMNGASMPGLEARDRRGGHPAFATDRNPDSPFADGLYVAWQDSCSNTTWSDGCDNGGSGMWVASSHDEGETWSEPYLLSTPQDADADWNIFPAVSVSPGGVVDVSWMSSEGTDVLPCHEETPDCEENYGEGYPKLTQIYSYSLDGGATWSEPFAVRDVHDGGWDPALCHHQNGMVFIGDYNDIDSSWQAAHPVWPDSREGVCDVFTATLQRPAFALGWDEEKKADAEESILAHPL